MRTAEGLDRATSEIAFDNKLGIEPTEQLDGGGFERSWPLIIKMDALAKAKLDKFLGNQ